MNQHTKPASRICVLAGVLFWIYFAGVVLALYIGVEDHWPQWALIVAAVIWGVLFLWLRVFVVKDLLYLMQGRPLRFSLRGLLLLVPVISVLGWLFIQLDWIEKRERWRRHNRTAARSTQSQAAPPGLVRLFEPGESWIEIKNGTKEQIEYAKRLFPEATVVVAGEAPDAAQAVPAVAPVEPQRAAGK